MTDSNFYFLRALWYWDKLPYLIKLFAFFLISVPIGFLPVLVYGVAVRKRHPETLKKHLQELGAVMLTIFAAPILFPAFILLIIVAGGVLIVVGVPFLIIKGIKFVWHF